MVFVECRASLAEVERRLRERERRGDSVSDASWEIAQRQEADFPPFDDIPASCRWVVDTEGDINEALMPVEDMLINVDR